MILPLRERKRPPPPTTAPKIEEERKYKPLLKSLGV
jgi:hypothetical protein